jgi:hypothetical protein
MATSAKASRSIRTTGLDDALIHEIAMDACIYAYPLVLFEMTRRATTNVETPTRVGQAPPNQFSHLASFPHPDWTSVVRPNADTLYSTLMYDVAREPLVLEVPDTAERYYLVQCLDAWSDVFESIGTRTTGTSAQRFVFAGPGWSGDAPRGVTVVRSPTSLGWLLGRIQTNGAADYESVHAIQRGLKAAPLSQLGKPFVPPPGTVNTSWHADLPPVDQVDQMSAETFLTVFAQASRGNPPHANDYPILHRMRRIGLEPGKPVSFGELSVEVHRALDEAWPSALERIKTAVSQSGISVNGWRINLTGIGTYGADYLHRAAVAYAGFGANTIEDAVYPFCFADADGNPLSAEERYVVHFEKGQLPPARAFWSLTLYDARQLFAANPIDRYALGDRDDLRFNRDGSLDLYIQRSSPGQDRQSNWLPAPAGGEFSLTMRLYWPKIAVTEGAWAPPPVKRMTP